MQNIEPTAILDLEPWPSHWNNHTVPCVSYRNYLTVK